MTENEFDELWQRAEAEGYGQRLAAEYPAWQRKQKRIATVVTSLVLLVAVAVSLHTLLQRQPQPQATSIDAELQKLLVAEGAISALYVEEVWRR